MAVVRNGQRPAAPDAGGTDLWARIREEHPALPVVFLNGTAVPARGRVSTDDYNPFVEGEPELTDETLLFLEEARAVFGDVAGG